jgi:hypothetical protein
MHSLKIINTGTTLRLPINSLKQADTNYPKFFKYNFKVTQCRHICNRYNRPNIFSAKYISMLLMIYISIHTISSRAWL